MAGSVNKVILIGNLGADPEVKTSQDGTSIVRFSIATSDQWKDRNPQALIEDHKYRSLDAFF